MKLKKWVCVLLAVFLLAGLFCMPALAAADDVADAVENTWTDAAEQIKTVVDSVVFPAAICAIRPIFISFAGFFLPIKEAPFHVS